MKRLLLVLAVSATAQAAESADVPAAAGVPVPGNAVLVEILEGVPADKGWTFPRPVPGQHWTQPEMGLVGLPRKYSDLGLISDRSSPFLVRLRVRRRFPRGSYQLLLRARSAARLSLDGRVLATTDLLNRNSSSHENVPRQAVSERPDLVSLSPGHQQRLVEVTFDGGEHLLQVEAFVGGKGLRAELGELLVGLARRDTPFRLVTAAGQPVQLLSDAAWDQYVRSYALRIVAWNDARRRSSDPRQRDYWKQRHELARRLVPAVGAAKARAGLVDRLVAAGGGTSTGTLVSDHAFLRRLALDTIGTIPTRKQIASFLADPPAMRREWAIDRFLADSGWADHWVGYWQDVLAENPGLLKPKLNNTGPFRWWIHESFRDNKPMDRFVTELVLMQGSRYGGGPAGFGLATQNDVPMAAKAHVLGTAFLGLQLQCARCHDAPYHPYRQRQLFELAAMLNRGPLTLPSTSTIPGGAPGGDSLVKVTLAPGAAIKPGWSFGEIAPETLPAGVLKPGAGTRQRLAALITSPTNRRFPRVLVNRLWQRYLGWGFVELADDWNNAEPVYPRLLDTLAVELVRSGYDLKHVARLILQSRTYQREVPAAAVPGKAPRQVPAPRRRRLAAEQLVDSLLVLSGKSMQSEALTLDPEGRRPVTSFLNLGVPRRAWELVPLSNERDRPALALPAAQSVLDLLLAFGWRESRPDPTTLRDGTLTVLQPLVLANGSLGHRIVVLSDDHALTELFLESRELGDLIEQLFLQVLSRPPTTAERAEITSLLDDGFAKRRVPGAARVVVRLRPTAVSWSNHLSPEATRIKLARERQVRAGDPPTRRLQPDWRERAEDVIWALVNSPEFAFVP